MKKLELATILALYTLAYTNLAAQESTTKENFKDFYIKPYGGFIGIQNMNLQLVESNENSNLYIENGFGFTTGISLGYNFIENFTVEVGWEYKRNDITVTNNNTSSKGDYASNFIYLNGIYNFSTKSKIAPYLGFGTSLIQEIDLDLGKGENTSFSNSGNIGFQAIIGFDFNFSKRWALNWEAKYVTFSKFDMENEANNDQLNNLKYNPIIVNIGVKYRF